ncbi:MAG: acyl-CoA reductase [Candidatus Binataceae bacterium]
MNAAAGKFLELSAAAVAAIAARVRAARTENSTPERRAEALARAFERWREGGFPARRAAIAQIARRTGFSPALLDASIDALLAPFTRDALLAMAARVAPAGDTARPNAIGFIVAGNVAGAGLHEIAIALIAGAAAAIKTASAEPVFFAEFARTIAECDPAVGERIAVLNWNRSRTDLTGALISSCDAIVAYGGDATIAALAGAPRLIGFPSRVSAAAVVADELDSAALDEIAGSSARDAALFEQLGCLSPHQVFVVGGDSGAALDFASRIAAAFDRLTRSMPPPAALALEDAAAIRHAREVARWRGIGGEPIKLWEGPRLDWTVISDPAAQFTVSPGFRTVYVSAVRDLSELRERLAPVAGRLEAFAIVGNGPECAEIAAIARALGASHVCAAGAMQSPPLDWRHGDGAFLDSMGMAL